MSDILEQLGYLQTAQAGALDAEQKQHVASPDMSKLSLAEIAALGRGARAYLDDYYALRDANAFDYAQAGIGGAVGGFVGGVGALGGMVAGGAIDLAAALNPLSDIPTNFAGTLSSYGQGLGDGLNSLINNSEQEALDRALAARTQARSAYEEAMYQQDLASGMGGFEAGVRDIVRGLSSGVDTFLDSGINATNLAGEAIGQLAAAGLTRGGASVALKGLSKIGSKAIQEAAAKTAAKKAGISWGDRAADAVALGGMEAAGQMVQANEELANISDAELYDNSADFRAYVQKYRDMGLPDAQSFKYARIEYARDTGLANAAAGGGVAFLAAGATTPLRHIGMAKGLQGIGKASVAEGTEEFLTGLGQSTTSNAIAQDYDPDRRLTEGTGQEMALSAILGGIAGGTGATPFAVRNSLASAQASLAQRRAEKAAQKASQAAKSTITPNATTPTQKQEENAPSPDSIETSQSQQKQQTTTAQTKKATLSTGATTYIPADLNIYKPFDIPTDEEARTEVVPKENGRIIKLNNLLKEYNSAPKDSGLKIAARDNFLNKYEALATNIVANFDTAQEFAKQDSSFNPEDDINYLKAQTALAAAQGQKITYGPSMDKATKSVVKTTYDQITFLAKQYDLLDAERAAEQAKAAKNTANAENQTNPSDLQQVAQGLSDNTLNPDNPDVKKTILKIRNKPNKTNLEKTIVSLYDLIKVEQANGLAKFFKPGAHRVIRNINTVNIGTKRPARDIVSNIRKAIARNNAEDLYNFTDRLNKLNDSHANKVIALQQALTENDNTTSIGYTSYNSKTLAPYTEKVKLESLPLYDQIVQEHKELVKLTNSVNSLVRAHNPQVDFPEVTEVAPLENEAELKEAYNATHKQRTSRKDNAKTSELLQRSEQIKQALKQGEQTTPQQEVVQNIPQQEMPQATLQQEVPQTVQEQEDTSDLDSLFQDNNQQAELIANTQLSQEQPIQQEPVEEQTIQQKVTEEQPAQQEPIKEQPIQEEIVEKQSSQQEVAQKQSIQEEEVADKQPTQEKVTQKQSTQQEETVEEVPQQEESPSTTQEESKVTEEDSSSLVQEEQEAPQQEAIKSTQEESTESTSTSSNTQEQEQASTTTTPQEEVQENASKSAPDESLNNDVVDASAFSQKTFEKLIRKGSIPKGKTLKDINKGLRESFTKLFDFDIDANLKAMQEKILNNDKKAKFTPVMVIDDSIEKSAENFNDILLDDLTGADETYDTAISKLRNFIFKKRDSAKEVTGIRGNTLISVVANAMQYKNIIMQESKEFNEQEFFNFLNKQRPQDIKAKNNLLPQNIIKNFYKNFSAYTESIFDNTDDSYTGSLDIQNWMQEQLNKGASVANLVFGLKLNDKGEVDYATAGSDRLFLIWTIRDMKGRIHFNQSANALMSLATLRVMQKLEQRLMCKTDEQIADNLLEQGVSIDVLQQANEEEKTAFQYGSSRERIIEDITREFMALANLQSNSDISMSFDGERAVTAYAQIAYRFLVQQGYLRENVYKFANRFALTNPNAIPDWVALNFETSPEGLFKSYTQQGIPIVNFQMATPLLAYKGLSQFTGQISNLDFSVLPKNSVFNDDIDVLLNPEPEAEEYHSVEDMPPVNRIMLNSNRVFITEDQVKAIEQRRKAPHYLEPTLYYIYKKIGLEGLYNLYDVNITPYNLQYSLTVNGKKQSLQNELDAAMTKAYNAVMYDPANPKYFNDYTINRIGRVQEVASTGDQASKVVRALFPNAKSTLKAIPETVLDKNRLLGFKLGVLQAYKVKTKNESREAIEEMFSRVENIMQERFSQYGYQLGKMGLNANNIVYVASIISEVTGSPYENAPLGLLATSNMLRYMQAKEANKSFTNTLTDEGDGSCNGFFNSHLVMNCGDVFSAQTVDALARSNYYVGDDETNVIEQRKISKLDNYTANAEDTSTELSAVIWDAKNKQRNGNELYSNGFTFDFNGEKRFITISDVFESVLNLLGSIDPGSVTFHEEALNGDANTDALNSQNVTDISRSAIKNPTTRINYGQGQKTNSLEVWRDTSEKLSKKISEIVQNANIPPYRVWFAKELEKGELTEELAYKKFSRIAQDFEILNSIRLTENREGKVIFSGAIALEEGQDRPPVLPSAFYLPKDYIMSQQQIQELMYYSPKRRSSYNSAFLTNLAYCYTNILYRVIDEARSVGFKNWMNAAAPFTQIAAALNGYQIKQEVSKFIQEHGYSPSKKQFSEIRHTISKKFPIIIRSPKVVIDGAKSQKINVMYTNQDQERKQVVVKGRRVIGGKIARGPFKGQSVIKDIETPISERVPADPGVSTVAIAVISNGDGLMQKNIFSQEGSESFTDRYDGVDLPADEYFAGGGSRILNQAVYDTLENAPIAGFLTNATSIKLALEESVEEDPNGQMFQQVHQYFSVYSPMYREYLSQHKESKEVDYVPKTKKELLDATINPYVNLFRKLHKNNFINNIVLRSMPATIAHMSAGPTELVVRDPRDHFRVPYDWSPAAKKEAIVKEMNRRKEWLQQNKSFYAMYAKFKETGKIEIPDGLFKDAPYTTEMEERGEPEITELVKASPQATQRELPNTRTNESREVSSSASLEQAPARETTQVQAGSTAINNKGKQSDELQSYINKFLEIKQLPKEIVPIAKNFFNKFLNTEITKSIQVNRVKSKDLASLGYTQDFSDSPAFYDPNKHTVYLIEDILTEEESPEVVVHELVHAVTAAAIANAYNGDKTSKTRVERLLKLSEEFTDLLEQRDVYIAQDFRDKIDSLKDPVQRAQEFVAYMLTHPQYIKFAQSAKPSHSYLSRVFHRFTQLLASLFGIKSKNELKAYLTFYGETIGSTVIILSNNPQPAIDISSLTETVQDHVDKRLVKLAAAIDTIITNSQFSPDQKLAFKTETKRLEKILDDLISNNVFKLDNKQKFVAASLATFYSTAIDLDSNAKIDALNFKEVVMEKLKASDLALPEDLNNTLLSEARYQFLAGNDSGSSLGLFMALASVSPSLRNTLKKLDLKTKQRALGLKRVVNANTSVVDDVVSTIGSRMFNYFNALARDGKKKKNAVEQVDSLVDNLLHFRRSAGALDLINQVWNNVIEGELSNKIDSTANAFLDGNTLKEWTQSNSRIQNTVAQALRVSVPFLMKQDSIYYKENKRQILEAINTAAIKNPSFYNRFFTSAFRELMATDATADVVYKAEKQAKATVQAVRTSWREVVPRELQNKFKEEGLTLNTKHSTALNRVILQADLGTLSNEMIDSILKNGLSSEIALHRSALTPQAINYSKQLAHYMVTGIASNGMLRNAEAIAAFSYKGQNLEQKTKIIDEYVTLLALQEDAQAFKVTQEVYAKAPNAFIYSVDQQRANRNEELKKVHLNTRNSYNYYKGYFPQDVTNSGTVRVVPLDSLKFYKSLGYKVRGYTTSSDYVYIESTLNPISSFNQGAIQSIINQTGGIDAITGLSPNNRVYRRIRNKNTVKEITQNLSRRKQTNESYIPILNSSGTVIIGYEVTVNPEMYSNQVLEQNFAKNLGAWRGRQLEEQLASESNKVLIEQLKNQYEKASSRDKAQFVNLIELAEKDPIVRDALNNLSPQALIDISGKPFLPEEFYVRQDLIPDIIGRRQASVLDLATGNTYWSPKVQKTVVKLMQHVAGPKAFAYLYRGETLIKNLTSSARNFIVIRSGEVMLFNLFSNFMSLVIRGVPIQDIVRLTPRITKELEQFNKIRQKQVLIEMAINAEKGKEYPSDFRIKTLQNRLREQKEAVDLLTYSRDLLKAGEYNTIADLGDVNDDILLSTGRWGDFLENKVKSMPNAVKEVGRQLIITKDTAIYRALEKGTRYGDFIAKTILYHHLQDIKKMPKEKALSKVRYEYVNYDMLPGRTREYLENMGLLWFYNYKLRIARTALSMLKENPLAALLYMISPISIGTPITDNIVVNILSGAGSSVGLKLFDIPWFDNHLWLNIFN